MRPAHALRTAVAGATLLALFACSTPEGPPAASPGVVGVNGPCRLTLDITGMT